MAKSVNVYRIEHRKSGKLYFGITVKPVNSRWLGHIRAAHTHRPNTAIARAIKKYGPEAFDVKHIVTCPDRAYAGALERRLIATYNTFAPNGFNLSSGGEDNVGFTTHPEVREKQRQGRLGKRHSEETRQKLRQIALGRKWSDEARAKVSQTRKRPWTEAQRASIRAAQQTPEYREKMRVASAKRKSPVWTEEMRAAQAERTKAHYAKMKGAADGSQI